MPTPLSPSTDYHAAVRIEFANRPTLRQVADRQLLVTLTEHLPLLASADLPSAASLLLQVPNDNASMPVPYLSWTPRPLLDCVMEVMQQGRTLASLAAPQGEFQLSVQAPYTLRGADGQAMPFTALSLTATLPALEALLLALPEYFCQAQVDYWTQPGSLGVPRERWLSQLIRSALLHNLPLQALDSLQQGCLLGLLSGGAQQPSVAAVEVRLGYGRQSFSLLLPELLVEGELDEGKAILWCSPSSVIQAFTSLDDFATALCKSLAQQYDFDTMDWNRYALEGDCFAQQCTLLLENMFESARRLRYVTFADVAAMEQAYAATVEPAQWFIEGYQAIDDVGFDLPPGLTGAGPAHSFAYQAGMFELALAQAQSGGRGALDGILDLHSYASRELRAQMLLDFPDDANYFSDDLKLKLIVARGNPGGAGAGVGGGLVDPPRYISLTEFAIGNLVSLQGATLHSIEHRRGQLIMDWMTPAYVKSLVERVDIGAHYPVYVARQLDDAERRPLRVRHFAREWRCSLLFSALSASLAGTLSDAALQCVTDYCRGLLDPNLPASVLMPLAFSREPGASQADQVTGMYVLFCTAPSTVLLYRPLYGKAALSEFASLTQMMEAIRTPGMLQDSILAWLPDRARAVYDNGGFIEPHLQRPIIDTSVLPEPVQPPRFKAQFWRVDVDAYLFKANRDLLVELADRQTISNAQSRWAILLEGAWLLFNVATVLLRGPVATVAWLVLAFKGLKDDLPALRSGTDFERSAAVVDLLLNASMALMHLRLPTPISPAKPLAVVRPQRVGLPAARALKDLSAAQAVQGKVGLPGALVSQVRTQLDFSWRGLQGFNMLEPEQRKALSDLRSPASLNGLQPLQAGPHRGLYEIAGRYYVGLAGDIYEVTAGTDGVRVVGGEGHSGPWLAFEHGQWRVDAALRLRAGMPKTRRELLRAQNEQRLEALRAEEVQCARQHNTKAELLNKHRELLKEKDNRIKELEASEAPDELTRRELDLTRRLTKQIRLKVIYELKDVIDTDLAHDNVMAKLYGMRLEDKHFVTVMVEQRSTIRQYLIDSVSAFYNELASVINNEGLDDLGEHISVHPEGETETSRYKQFRSTLETVVKWETDLVEMSQVLDRLVEQTLKDDSIQFKSEQTGARINKDIELKEIIDKRRLSAIDLEFRLLQDLGELCLDRLADVDESVLRDYHDYLVGDGLRSAGNAHGDLHGSSLTLPQRMEVLTGVLEAYEEAFTMASYLRSVGGAAVRVEQLQAYQKVLAELKNAAEKDLAQLVREKELEAPQLSKPSVFAPRGGRRHLVRTSRGRSVLAEEFDVDGVAVVQQRDFRTQHVLKTFRQQGQEWVEDATRDAEQTGSPSSPREPAVSPARARALITQADSVISLARSYVKDNEPLSLSTVIDGHVQKLEQVKATLKAAGSDKELLDDLQHAISHLQAVERDLLTSLYLSTNRPNANSLRYLVKESKVSIHQAGPRKALAGGDYLDIYEVRRLPRGGQATGEGLWEVHFHYPAATTPVSEFSRGHLKLWSQRKLGRQAQMRAATSGRELLDIYRAELRLRDIEGVIELS